MATAGPLGSSSDWLLDRAVAPAEPDQDPGDATWGEATEENVKQTVKEVATAVAWWGGTALAVVAGAAVLYLLVTRRQTT